MKVLILIFALAALATALQQGSPREQLQEDYGYVEVRPGAHIFWVMYHVDQPGDNADYPLIMWLQGGPGASGVGYGNFEELGPYDINGNAREHAWTKKANVMFVDNPVGTGYSYVDDYSKLATDNAMIASDLVAVVKAAFVAHPHMQVMPFYVFAESYGGKMTVDFAIEFEKAIKMGEVVSDFRGVALGDSWISPMDSVNTWGTFLYQMGFVNRNGLEEIDTAAGETQAAVDAGRWTEATDYWSYTEGVVLRYGNGVNFYNVLAENDIYLLKKTSNKTDLSFMSSSVHRLYENHVAWQTRDLLGNFMNGPQAEHWGIPEGVVWDSQGGMVFATLAGDFMKPVIDSVVKLLTETDLHVAVFTGNLDLICDTPGTYRWIENMEWPGKPSFMAASNEAISIPSYSATAATVQAAGQFSVYTILRSGHMVPIDAPEMSLKMLDMIFASTKEKPSTQETLQEKVVKKDTVKQEVPSKTKTMPERDEELVQKTHTLRTLKEEALNEETKKEKEIVNQDEQEESQEHKEEQKTHEEENKKQKATKEEKVAKEKQSKKAYKQANPTKQEKHKQEKVAKQEKQKQEKAPKQEETKQEKQRQEKSPKQEETKQKENKQEKAPKQEKQKQEKAPKQEKTKQKENKQENVSKQEKQKQEKSPKQEEIKQNENKQDNAPKQDKYKEKLAKPDKYKQNKVGNHEKNKQEKYKQKETKQEKSFKQEKQAKKESFKEGAKGVNKAKAKVTAARQHQQGRHSHHNPGPLSDAPPRR